MHDYFQIILDDPLFTVAVFFLAVIRMIPIVVLVPFFGAKLVPGSVRIVFSVCLVSMILPYLVVHSPRQTMFFDAYYIALAFKEFFVGVILGYLATIPFVIVQSAGTIIDHQRGASSLMVSDPSSGSQVSPIGLMYNYLLIALFFLWGGPYRFIEVIFLSYKMVGIDEFLAKDLFEHSSLLFQTVVTLAAKIMALSVQFAAPSLLAILMADMFLGIANRLATQVQITFLGMPLKSWLAILLLMTSLGIVLKVTSKESIVWMKKIHEVVESMDVDKGKVPGKEYSHSVLDGLEEPKDDF